MSSAEGIEVCAPLTVAESAAAADALRKDSFLGGRPGKQKIQTAFSG